MKRLGVLALAALLLFTAACGRSGERRALELAHNNRSMAARILKISRTALYDKMLKYRLT